MRKFSTLLFVFALVVAGCNGSSADTTTTSIAEATPSTSGATTTTVAVTTTSSPTTTTTTSAASGGGSDCLVGTWLLDSESFVENFDAIFADAGMPDTEVSALEGTFTVDLAADGSLEAEREAWGFRIETSEGTIVLEINGTETGTWSADDSTLTVDTDMSDISVAASIEADGQTFPLPEGQFPIEPPEGIATGSEYTCSGDTLKLTNAGVESVLNRA